MGISQLFTPPSTALSGGLTITGNGFVVHNRGQLVTRELLGAPGVDIGHSTGLDGSPLIRSKPSLFTAGVATLDLSTTVEQTITLTGYDFGIIKDIVFFDASGDITAATVTLTTAQAGTGRILATAQPLAGMSGGTVDFLAVAAANAPCARIPVVFATVASTEALTVKCAVIVQALTVEPY